MDCPVCGAGVSFGSLRGHAHYRLGTKTEAVLYECTSGHYWVVREENGETRTVVIPDGLPSHYRNSILADIDFLKKNDVQLTFDWEME
jgi:hypothetical protein